MSTGTLNLDGIGPQHYNLFYVNIICLELKLDSLFKDVVTPYTHISEASRYILYTIILTFDGICTLS